MTSISGRDIYKYNSKNHITEETKYITEEKFGEFQDSPKSKIVYEYEYY